MTPAVDTHSDARLRKAQRALRKTILGLASQEVTTVEVEYDGSGDSGMVESIVFKRDREPVDVPTETDVVVEDYLEALLEVHEPGWELDEGSFGTAVIDFAQREVRIEHNSRYTTFSEHAYREAL